MDKKELADALRDQADRIYYDTASKKSDMAVCRAFRALAHELSPKASIVGCVSAVTAKEPDAPIAATAIFPWKDLSPTVQLHVSDLVPRGEIHMFNGKGVLCGKIIDIGKGL